MDASQNVTSASARGGFIAVSLFHFWTGLWKEAERNFVKWFWQVFGEVMTFLGQNWSREKAKCGFISGVHLREASPTIMWALGGLKPPTGCNSRNYTSYWDPPSQPPYPPSLPSSQPPSILAQPCECNEYLAFMCHLPAELGNQIVHRVKMCRIQFVI